MQWVSLNLSTSLLRSSGLFWALGSHRGAARGGRGRTRRARSSAFEGSVNDLNSLQRGWGTGGAMRAVTPLLASGQLRRVGGAMEASACLARSNASTSPVKQQQQHKDQPSISMSSSAPSAFSAIQFLTLCQRLKTTKRTGWVNHGLKESESIADHMYRMAIMALIAADGVPGVDKDRCVKMAVVHDLAEAIVGDITPSDNVPKEEKSRREREAMDEMCAMLGGGLAAQEMMDLWQEYENNATPEAKLVKDFDKVEMILQAHEYEQESGKDLEDFFRTTRGKFQTDVGQALAAEVVKRRTPSSTHNTSLEAPN